VRVCVFAGTFASRVPEHRTAAQRLGQTLGESGLRAVYGGGCTGLMGAFADAALRAGAEVIGVVPEQVLELERRLGLPVVHRGLTELRVVGSLAERKAAMAALADAFVALPGGVGTLEELLEAVTEGALGLHAKPCGIVNTAGFFDPLVAQLDAAADAGLLRAGDHRRLQTAADPAALVSALAAQVA
jgi:uncharacterized protein (TIGR00730 family)